MAENFDVVQHMAAMEKTMGLNINSSWRPSIAQHLSIASEMAELVQQVPLRANTLDLANTFCAAAIIPAPNKSNTPR